MWAQRWRINGLPYTGSNFANRVLEAAGIGGWELDVATEALHWSRLTFLIHEVEPGHQPGLAEGLDFYPPEARPIIAQAVQDALHHGTPWDLELPFVTARGRRLWVRACGLVERLDGRTVKLTGSFEDITARRELTERADRLSLVVRQMTNAVIIADAHGLIEWVNDAFCRLTGYGLDELRGRKPGHVLQGPETDPATVRRMRESLARGEGFEVEIVNYTRQRQPYFMAITCTPLRDAGGTLTGFIAVESDISARREAEREAQRLLTEQRRAEALLRDVLEALPSAVSAYDRNDRLILTNPAYARIFPLTAPFAQPGQPLEAMVRLAVAAGQYPEAGPTPAERDAWIAARLALGREPGPARTLALPGGRCVLASESRSESGNLVCVRMDTTELQQAEAALRRQAEQDPLTLLANRACLLAALDRRLALAADNPAEVGALLIFDVDHFKQINDTLGHDVGDAVLIEVAARLRKRSRANDVAARLGGDEFAVLLPGLRDVDTLAARATEIQAALAEPMAIAGRWLEITISAGMTRYPADGGDAQTLLKNADLALYEAKRTGRARWCDFRAEQAAELARHTRIATALRSALASDALQVAFQPKRLLQGGHAGFEALARWHDGADWVPPSEFIPVAEANGLITPLGTTVLDAALARVRALRDLGHEPGRVAVNVTGPQLLHAEFVADVSARLQRHGLGPADLELEITETVLIGRAADQIEKTLRELRALGITLALDDFGTGFASLANLSRLPIDRLKIDRSFVAEIGLGGRGGVIARTVIGLARSLGMESVAEGVETAAQLAFLKAEGCDAAQGYLFSRPILSLDATSTYLRGEAGPAWRKPDGLDRTAVPVAADPAD